MIARSPNRTMTPQASVKKHFDFKGTPKAQKEQKECGYRPALAALVASSTKTMISTNTSRSPRPSKRTDIFTSKSKGLTIFD